MLRENSCVNFRIVNNYEIQLNSEDIIFFSERRILKTEPVFLIFSYEGDQKKLSEIGYVQFDLRLINKNAYITYYVKPEYRGKGFGNIIISIAIDFAFKEMGLRRLTAEVYEYNERSVNLLKALGFEVEGVLREAKYHNERFWDIIIMGLLREKWKV